MLIAVTRRIKGFSMIELVIVLALLLIVVGMVVPSFKGMMQNTQVRNAAESIVNGLHKARGEAIARNTNVEFAFGVNTAWTVRVAGGADIETRVASEGSKDVTRTAVASDLVTAATVITFNGMGAIVANSGATPTLSRVDLTVSGASKPLRVNVGVGGNAKLCDPSLASGSSPRAC